MVTKCTHKLRPSSNFTYVECRNTGTHLLCLHDLCSLPATFCCNISSDASEAFLLGTYPALVILKRVLVFHICHMCFICFCLRRVCSWVLEGLTLALLNLPFSCLFNLPSETLVLSQFFCVLLSATHCQGFFFWIKSHSHIHRLHV